MEKIGEVTTITKKLEFKWKIQNFFLLSEDDDLYVSSPSFHFADTNWYLNLYPNGDSENNSNGYVDIYLLRESSGSPITLQYTLSVKSVNGKKIYKKYYTSTFENEKIGYGMQRFVSRSDLLDKKSELMPTDVLTVVCSVKYPHPDKAKMDELYDDFKGLMDTGDYSDTIIQVKGKEFNLHKNILAARNPFFDSMFKTDMRENLTGIVSIDDCKPEVFNSFIHFVYTGYVDKLSVENVCDLYEVADMYQQDQLKEECLQFMLNSMTVDNFCDFVVMAIRHDDKKLLKNAIKFFSSKITKIILSMKWVTFQKEYPTYAKDFHLRFIEDYEDEYSS